MTPDPPWLRTAGLCRFYRRGRHEVRAVDRVDLDVRRGEFLGLTGASGSGKSTMLNLLAGMDTPSAGRVELEGVDLGGLSPRELARYRARRVGLVFQSFNLLPQHSALKNVEMALLFDGTPPPERRPRAARMLERLGLGDRLGHRPPDLSGGEQQRVAMARALVKRPDVLFADEPTGNLDQENTGQIAGLLTELNGQGLTIILATHDLDLAARLAERVVRMRYGRLEDDGPGSPAGGAVG